MLVRVREKATETEKESDGEKKGSEKNRKRGGEEKEVEEKRTIEDGRRGRSRTRGAYQRCSIVRWWVKTRRGEVEGGKEDDQGREALTSVAQSSVGGFPSYQIVKGGGHTPRSSRVCA